jgi:gliding motility-associated transport system ATP-binding protein
MIKVDNLSKSFGAKRAVDGVSFEVGKGEVLGFLGPNGAGKSTTMRMITGFIPPSGGSVSVCGHDMVLDPVPGKRRIGYLPEAAPSYTDMTVLSFLNFAADIRGLRGDARRKGVRRAVDACYLEPVLGQTIDTLSKGFRHRTCFAQAIIHDPDVLIMDEPTDGLDPNQKHEVRTLIREMGRDKAIIFSTHILEEVEAACTRAIIIDRGRIVANGTPDELKARSERAGAVLVKLGGATPQRVTEVLAESAPVARSEILASDPGWVVARAYPRKPAPEGALAARVAELAVRERWKIEELVVEEGRLDDVFRSLTWSETREGAQP